MEKRRNGEAATAAAPKKAGLGVSLPWESWWGGAGGELWGSGAE